MVTKLHKTDNYNEKTSITKYILLYMYQVRVLYLPYKCRQTKRHIQTSFYPSLSIHSQGRGFLEQENIEKKEMRIILTKNKILQLNFLCSFASSCVLKCGRMAREQNLDAIVETKDTTMQCHLFGNMYILS